MDSLFNYSNHRKLLPSLWVSCNIKKTEKLPYDIDGDCVYEVRCDPMMSSSKDGRSWNARHTSKTYVPTLPDYPGVSRIRNESPGLPYGLLNLPDKYDSEPVTDVSPF